MKYKVGDKVKVKSWEEIQKHGEVKTITENPNANAQKYVNDKLYGIWDFVYPVMQMPGVCTIEFVLGDGYFLAEYEGDEDAVYEDWMLEAVEE